MNELESISAIVQECYTMHTNHWIRHQWIQVIVSMLRQVTTSGLYTDESKRFLITAIDVLACLEQDQNDHTTVKTHLRIAATFIEKAVEKHSDEAGLSPWVFVIPQGIEATQPDFAPPGEQMEDIPF